MEEKEMHETQPASPIPPDLEITPAFPTKMHPKLSQKSKWFLLLIVGFLIIYISISTLQFLAQHNQSLFSNTSPTPTPAINTSPSKNSTKEKTTNKTPLFWNVNSSVDRKTWSTFIKDNYFSIQHPKEFIVTEEESSVQFASRASGAVIIINFKKVTNGSKIILANAPAEFSTCPLIDQSYKGYSSIKDVFLDYREAVMITNADCPPDNPTIVYGINTYSPNILYEIVLLRYYTTEKSGKEINDIIPTFEFLYPSQAPAACNEEDQSFCEYKEKIQDLFSQKNFSALIAEQQLASVTCKKLEGEHYYPLPTICDGQPDGGVVYGYKTIRNQSEGGVFSKDALQVKYNSNFSTSALKPSGPLIYQGYKLRDNKALIVYTDRIQSNLLAFYLEKKADSWKIAHIIDGIASGDFLTLNDSLLGVGQE